LKEGGATNGEIADFLGTTPDSVRMMLCRMRVRKKGPVAQEGEYGGS
jgi:hypothetical protein